MFALKHERSNGIVEIHQSESVQVVSSDRDVVTVQCVGHQGSVFDLQVRTGEVVYVMNESGKTIEIIRAPKAR